MITEDIVVIFVRDNFILLNNIAGFVAAILLIIAASHFKKLRNYPEIDCFKMALKNSAVSSLSFGLGGTLAFFHCIFSPEMVQLFTGTIFLALTLQCLCEIKHTIQHSMRYIT